MTQEFVTLPREVVTQALDALEGCRVEYDYHGNPVDASDQDVINARTVLRAALEQPQGVRETAPNGATHIQPQQGAFYKRVDEKWYVWSLMEDGRPRRWYISPGTVESCLKPISAATEQPQDDQEPAAEHELKDVRCECCGYMTHHREHMGCIRAAQPKREPLTDEQIDAIAESMPGGLDGFLKGWGWRQFARAVLEAAPQPPVVGQLSMTQAMRDFIEGMSVSVDVSTGEHDAGHRYFGTVTEVMDAPEDKHGVTLLVQDAEPNFERLQNEQEPVARVVGTGHIGGHFDWCKPDSQDDLQPGALLYTRPHPQQEPQGEQEICCKIWSVNRIEDLGKIVDSSGRLIATVYGSQADKIVACHNSYTQQRHEREPLTDEQIAAATGAKPGTPTWLVAVAFTRAIEAAHGITEGKK